MRRLLRPSLAAVSVFAVVGAVALGGEPGRIPAYAWKPGQELRYRESSEFRYNNRSKKVIADSSEIRFRVVRANPDGSVRVLFDAKERSKTTREPVAAKSAQAVLKGFAAKVISKAAPEAAPQKDVSFKMAAFDLFPDGRTVLPDSLDMIINDPTAYFPLLPRAEADAASGWTNPQSGPSGDRVNYRLVRQDPGEWVVDAEFDRWMNKVYDASLRHRIFFDVAQGRVRRIETEDAMGYKSHARGQGVVEFVAESTIPAEPLAKLASEMDSYLDARERSFQLLLKAGDDPNLAEKRLDEADALLKQAQSRLTLADFAEPLAKWIEDTKGSRSYYLDQAKRKAEMVGQAAPDWELKDLADKTHSLAGYRGQVVVLDFWYRGCGWCVRSMPQMKQLADDFLGQPVGILGMNKDHEVKDARFVADAMGLNYPTLRAEGIPEKYQVQGFPTLILIDRQGKIADFHDGYSPQLRLEVGNKIKQLLDNPSKAAMNPKVN